jgi:hypothetical protein
MFRGKVQKGGEHKVHVLFTRSLEPRRISTSLHELALFLERHHYFAFVDGPWVSIERINRRRWILMVGPKMKPFKR